MKPNTKIVTLDDKEQKYENIAFIDSEGELTTLEKENDLVFILERATGQEAISLMVEDIPLLIKALQEFQKL